MRGSDVRSGALFSYVGLEARIRRDHPLRRIRGFADAALEALTVDFAALYSGVGRPSIPPEMLLRAMLLQAFYSIRSERQLMERLEFDLLFRWFVGLGVDDAAWDHSTFSKNRDRLLEGEIAAKFLAAVLAPQKVKQLLSADHFSVNGTLIEAWASMKSFAAGTPAHDHLGDILATLDAEAFQRCFVAWVAALIGVPEGVVAIDGKTVRRSKGVAKDAIHMVSAFAACQRLVLGQVKVADKANEIVAIPKLLDMLAIEGAVVTIDAMGCQRAIAQKIVDKKADYILALKGNQGSLREDVELFAAEQKAKDFKDTTVTHHRTVDGKHGRVETRDITVIHDVGWLQMRHNWPALAGVVMVQSTRVTPGLTRGADKIERETRFYITSLALIASLIGPLVRDHWAIENSLHWVLDMVFRDDECRLRTDNAPANFTTLKHMALNLIRRAKSKDSIRLRRKVAAWDDEFLVSLIAT